MAPSQVSVHEGAGLPARPWLRRSVRARSITAAGARRHDVNRKRLERFRLERQFGFRIADILGEDLVRDGVLALDFEAMPTPVSPAPNP